MAKKDKTFQNEYRTGGPIHRRSYGALFAVGMFLFFAVTGMLLTAGLLGLRISTLSTQKVIATLDTPDETIAYINDLHMDGLVMDCADLGITCQSISEFCENFYELPKGIYVIHVEKNTPAAKLGILPGDILTKAAGRPIQFPVALQNILAETPNGQPIQLDFIRKGKNYTVTLIPGA